MPNRKVRRVIDVLATLRVNLIHISPVYDEITGYVCSAWASVRIPVLAGGLVAAYLVILSGSLSYAGL
jgi:hypothetical protein